MFCKVQARLLDKSFVRTGFIRFQVIPLPPRSTPAYHGIQSSSVQAGTSNSVLSRPMRLVVEGGRGPLLVPNSKGVY